MAAIYLFYKYELRMVDFTSALCVRQYYTLNMQDCFGSIVNVFGLNAPLS